MQLTETHRALASALRDGNCDPLAVAHEVGACAAQLGYSVAQMLEGLEDIYRHACGAMPDYNVTKTAVCAWQDRSAVMSCEVSCDNPLTGLATLPHLRHRLDDVYRIAEAEGRPAGELYAVIVLELAQQTSDPLALEDVWLTIRAAEALRVVFDRDETFAQVAPGRIGVLVQRERLDRLNVLRRVLRGYEITELRLWAEGLPAHESHSAAFLHELAG